MDRITIIKNDLDEAIECACEKLKLSKQDISYSVTGCTKETITIEAWKKKQQSKLRPCQDCGKEISRKAEVCPHCGCPVEKTVTCPYCGYDTDKTYEQIQELGCYVICENCGKKVAVSTPEQELRWEQQKLIEANQPKCPTCSSTNIKKVSATSKAVSVALFGIFSQKVKKQWHCNNCGSDF